MTITQRDRRALMLAVPAIAVILIYAATSPKQTVVVAPRGSNESVASMTQRLAGMRQSVARVPGKEALLKQVSAELTEREKNLIVADTAAQATEQLLQIVRTIARSQGPAVELRSVELGQPKSFGDAYGEVTVSVTTECKVDQLVNLMSDISARKELVATRDLRVSAANPKEKTVSARLTFAALVPKKLVPQKKDSF